MKLYATTTSERASKGQGGEYLFINIKDERGVSFGFIYVRKENDKAYPVIRYFSHGLVQEVTAEYMQVIQDNKEQKPKSTKYCTDCQIGTWDSAGFEDGLCDKCWDKKNKGKKQKDGKCIHDWDNYGKCCICGQFNTQ